MLRASRMLLVPPYGLLSNFPPAAVVEIKKSQMNFWYLGCFNVPVPPLRDCVPSWGRRGGVLLVTRLNKRASSYVVCRNPRTPPLEILSKAKFLLLRIPSISARSRPFSVPRLSWRVSAAS